MARRSVKGKSNAKPAPAGQRKRIAFMAVAGVVVLLVGSFFAVGRLSRGQGSGSHAALTLRGEMGPDVETLQQAGIVGNGVLARAYLSLTGQQIRAGEHLLPDNASLEDVARMLAGVGPKEKVVFPEGITRFEMGRRLEAAGVCSKRAFVAATQSAPLLAELRVSADSFEGFLFPATYDFPRDVDAADVVRRLKGEFERRFAQIEGNHASSRLDLAKALHWGTREFVTLASMVEKEAVVDEERAVVASVFVNRLRSPTFTPKRLQCDPTGMYGCVLQQEGLAQPSPGCAHYAGKATHDVNVDTQNVYSTYTHEGLPPGPIANPGAKSLAAALDPALTNYLYFVAKGQGRHTFSETYGAHERAVRPKESEKEEELPDLAAPP